MLHVTSFNVTERAELCPYCILLPNNTNNIDAYFSREETRLPLVGQGGERFFFIIKKQ
jgi:hypothetical protein